MSGHLTVAELRDALEGVDGDTPVNLQVGGGVTYGKSVKLNADGILVVGL